MDLRDIDNLKAISVNSTRDPKTSNSVIKRVVMIMRKYWYLLVIALIALVVGVAWFLLSSIYDSAWEKATDHFTRAEYSKAEKLIVDFEVPKDSDRQRVYAQTMQATGNIDKALSGYEALYESTKDTSARMSIGNIYNQKQDYDKAISIYQEIVADNTSNVQAYVNMATVYRLQGKKQEAIDVSREAVNHNPRNVTLLELQVSMLLEDKESVEYQEAVAALREVSPEDPLLEALEQ